eukprot:CAMPEP_0171095716 /NCGR_PEP_ID=MMETSP0766_2-20121228/43333_1 /TAXON_ID=439317 /ORGANISM="Gambierdiscus australes, Strain CAWD 149" /LENGTH=192 /DNA_ID=CAMNT_0011554565 /DNA_START=127 /DNA_END=708 /DNA_ORIENTATION=+
MEQHLARAKRDATNVMGHEASTAGALGGGMPTAAEAAGGQHVAAVALGRAAAVALTCNSNLKFHPPLVVYLPLRTDLAELVHTPLQPLLVGEPLLVGGALDHLAPTAAAATGGSALPAVTSILAVASSDGAEKQLSSCCADSVAAAGSCGDDSAHALSEDNISDSIKLAPAASSACCGAAPAAAKNSLLMSL